METIELMQGDCREKMKEIPTTSVDAVITDPPYELGFMGKKWDSSGIAYDVEMWKECLRVLKPGGHLLSFGGTRTYHRMACAIEDAGFEIRDMIEWVYGSGFPKSHNIGKAVDKLQGNKREEAERVIGRTQGKTIDYGEYGTSKYYNKTKGSFEWEGYGTALKPAHEPICMARKPLEKGLTVAKNVLKWGTGGLNIDACRVGTDKIIIKGGGVFPEGGGCTWTEINQERTGRFPANLIHDGSKEVRDCFPETKSGARKKGKYGTMGSDRVYGCQGAGQMPELKSSSGNASRFFKSIIYQAKASKKERGEGNNHPTVKPVALMEYLVIMFSKEGQTILDPFMGSGTTGVACVNTDRAFIGIELGED